MQRDGGMPHWHPEPEVRTFEVHEEDVRWSVAGHAISVVVRRNGRPVWNGGDQGTLSLAVPPESGDVWTLWAGDQWGRTATATVTIP
jgi:hypothetical protein